MAASISPIAVNGVTVNGIELEDSGGQSVATQNCPTQAICRSQMLTVWRRLHVEVDSMGTATQNFVVGNSTTFARIRSFGPAVTLNVNTTDPLEINRFENGRIVVAGRQLRVVSNTATSVTVTNTLPPGTQVIVSVGDQFQLYDDDDFDNDNGNSVTGDTGEDIDPPDLGYLQTSDIPCDAVVLTNCNIFAQAYVTPVYDVTTDVTDNHFFQTNVDEHTGDAIRSLFTGFNQQATEASEDFWTVYLLSGYQYTIDRDEDPETEAPNVFAGVTDVQNGMGSIVFMETNGPKECNLTGSFCIIADTAAHEIGHQANADHGEGGIMDGLSNSFSPTSLSSIRNSTHP